MATTTAQIWTAVTKMAPAERAETALVTAEFLTSSALGMLADPTVPLDEILASINAATNVYAEMAR